MTTDWSVSGQIGGAAPAPSGSQVPLKAIGDALTAALSSAEAVNGLLYNRGITLADRTQVKFGSNKEVYKEALRVCRNQLLFCVGSKDEKGMLRIGTVLSHLITSYPQFADNPELKDDMKESRFALKDAGRGLSGRASREPVASRTEAKVNEAVSKWVGNVRAHERQGLEAGISKAMGEVWKSRQKPPVEAAAGSLLPKKSINVPKANEPSLQDLQNALDASKQNWHDAQRKLENYKGLLSGAQQQLERQQVELGRSQDKLAAKPSTGKVGLFDSRKAREAKLQAEQQRQAVSRASREVNATKVLIGEYQKEIESLGAWSIQLHQQALRAEEAVRRKKESLLQVEKQPRKKPEEALPGRPEIEAALASARQSSDPSALLPLLVRASRDAVRYAAWRMSEARKIDDPDEQYQAVAAARRELAATYEQVSGLLAPVDAGAKDTIKEKLASSLDEVSMAMLARNVSDDSVKALQGYAEAIDKVVAQPPSAPPSVPQPS